MAGLSKPATLMLVRIMIAVTVLLSEILQTLTPITLSALAAIALPMSLPLASPVAVSVTAYARARRIIKDTSTQQKERLRQMGITVSIIVAGIIFITFAFAR